MCRKKGEVVLLGTSGMQINREDMYLKELDFKISTSLSKLLVIENIPISCIAARPPTADPPPLLSSSLISTEEVISYTGV